MKANRWSRWGTRDKTKSYHRIAEQNKAKAEKSGETTAKEQKIKHRAHSLLMRVY